METTVTDFNTYSLETVPAAGRDTLETVNKAYGFVPNLIGTMVEAPALAAAYLDIGKRFGETSFTETERQVVLITASRINGCEYCMAAHSTVAGMAKVPGDVVDAIRNDTAIADERLEALRQFTVAVVEKRGWLDQADLDAFFSAGFGRQQVLEVVLGVAMKTLSNFTNHIAEPALDDAFKANEWHAPTTNAA